MNTPGAYEFQVIVTDTSKNTSTAKVTVKVKAPATPVAPIFTISDAQSIVLPANTVTVSGTASVRQGGASIHSVTWSRVSGPNTAAIATPTQFTTVIKGW